MLVTKRLKGTKNGQVGHKNNAMVYVFLACSLFFIAIIADCKRLGRNRRMAHMDKLEKKIELEAGAFNYRSELSIN